MTFFDIMTYKEDMQLRRRLKPRCLHCNRELEHSVRYEEGLIFHNYYCSRCDRNLVITQGSIFEERGKLGSISTEKNLNSELTKEK